MVSRYRGVPVGTESNSFTLAEYGFVWSPVA
jgi:hypothetical protein